MASAFERITGALSALGKRKQPPPSDTITDSPNSSSKRRVVFRPWDQQDMHRRLETYRPLTWFAKPEVVSPIACASRGWFNEARDQLCCEFCNARLIYPQSIPFDARQRAASLFAEQLTTRHHTHCPWRTTQCDDSVLVFNPGLEPGTTTPNALQNSYQTRLSKLERMEQLPDVYHPAIHSMARQASSGMSAPAQSEYGQSPAYGPDCLRRLLVLPAPGDAAPPEMDPLQTPQMPPAFDPDAPIVLPARMNMAQKARLLALLGWDAEEIPAGSSGRPAHMRAYRPSAEAYTLAHLVGRPSQGGGPDAGVRVSSSGAGGRWNMDNVVLNCHSCKSRVGLWNFIPNQHAASPLALPAPPHKPSVVIEELPDDEPVKDQDTSTIPAGNGDMEMDAEPAGAATLHPTPSVSLVQTIAGGSYDQSLSAAGAGFESAGIAPVFGNPAATTAPVYGLHALGAGASSRASSSSGAAAGTGVGGATKGLQPPVGVFAGQEGRGAVAAGKVGPAGHKRKASEDALQDAPPTAHAATRTSSTGAARQSKRPRMPSLGGGAVRSGAGLQAPDSFDPLQHHRNWCPWVFTGNQSKPSSNADSKAPSPAPQTPPPAATARSMSTSSTASSKCGWMHLLDSLAAAAVVQGRSSLGGMQGAGGPVEGMSPAPAGAGSEVAPMEVQEPAGTPPAASVLGAAGQAPTKDMASVKDNILAALRGM